jgi:hypothetical protein
MNIGLLQRFEECVMPEFRVPLVEPLDLCRDTLVDGVVLP